MIGWQRIVGRADIGEVEFWQTEGAAAPVFDHRAGHGGWVNSIAIKFLMKWIHLAILRGLILISHKIFIFKI